MNEAKPFASLSSGLLARKGMAKPAMRPHNYSQPGAGLDDLGWNDMGHARPAPPQVPSPYEAPHEEHVPSPISALTPMSAGSGEEEEEYEPAPPVVEQQRAAIEASFAEPAEERAVLAAKAPKEIEEEAKPEAQAEIVAEEQPPVVELARPERPQASVARKSKAAFTLRLDGDRHLKLRLACAVSGRSAQQLVTEALDHLLQSRPEVEALAGQVPAKAVKPY
ncbi:MAG TPA: hypothetical protein VNT77_01440 [Allosphingosinicella sp.]|nr:hypothetical protein [Allosphingosinicella sp.]